MTLVDPLGKLLTEIRDDPGVAAITTRIRGGQPAAGDALGPGAYVPFVVVSRLGRSRLKHCPTQEVRLVAKCYAATDQAAEALAGAVSDAVHGRGRRITSAGASIFDSFDDGGEGATKDPDTGQPMATILISVGSLTSLLP